MKLGPANQELFGSTPRYVGLVGPERGKKRNQFLAFDRANFRLFLESNYGDHNMYTRISSLQDGASVLDEVFLDLDIEKPDEDNWAAKIIPEMREDRMVADDILGGVVADARKAAQYLDDVDWPAIGVFSGLGIHIHALTKPKEEPGKELQTMVKQIESEAGLKTLDERGARQGDYNRLCRIANAPRISAEGDPVGLYTIPLTVEEMKDITPEALLRWSTEPRQIQTPDAERPEMEVIEEYEVDVESGVVSEGVNEIEEVPSDAFDDQFEEFMKDVLKMPCVYKRAMSRNPSHDIRLQAAVLMYNAGMTPKDVEEIFARFGWFDFDRDTTRKHLEHIWDNGYASMSCTSLQEKGLCVFEQDEREECPTFGWKGGQASYNQ